jgi:hypothetical protein
VPGSDLAQWLSGYDRRDSPGDELGAGGRPGGRLDLWGSFARASGVGRVAEIGVWTGRFAERLLDHCPGIDAYYMIDPWRHLDAWNKPANKDDSEFEEIFREAMRRTEAHSAKRTVLRGTTREMVRDLPDGLDFVYVDGDHTLRGITVDLVSVFPKVREGGWIGGDDFQPSIWQHGEEYEPTLVFPFAVYFAEAMDVPIYGLPHRQFLIEKSAGGFEFVDLTGRFGELELRGQLAGRRRGARRRGRGRRVDGRKA